MLLFATGSILLARALAQLTKPSEMHLYENNTDTKNAACNAVQKQRLTSNVPGLTERYFPLFNGKL